MNACIQPDWSEMKLENLCTVTAALQNTHVRESQYFTQKVECAEDLTCAVDDQEVHTYHCFQKY